MKKILILIATLTFAAPAFANDAPATVTLTQAELQAIINASLANAAAQAEITKARDALAKTQSAFAPPKVDAAMAKPEKK